MIHYPKQCQTQVHIRLCGMVVKQRFLGVRIRVRVRVRVVDLVTHVIEQQQVILTDAVAGAVHVDAGAVHVDERISNPLLLLSAWSFNV